MADLPIKFAEKVKLPASAGGTGYPYRISADDLDRNFAYAALDAEDDWIEQSSVGGFNGRKLRLPALPGSGNYVLGGNLEWIDMDELIKSLQDQIDSLVERLDSANITAQCYNGEVQVTLNI